MPMIDYVKNGDGLKISSGSCLTQERLEEALSAKGQLRIAGAWEEKNVTGIA